MAFVRYEGHKLAYTIHGRGAGKIAAFVEECWDGSSDAEPAHSAASA
jgi:hypothetical protein